MGAEATIEIEQGKVWPSLSDMISQSKDWPNEVGSKGWGGDKDKELLLASFYAQWDQYLHPTTGVFIAFGFIPEMLSKGIYSFSYAIEKAYLNMFKLFGMFDYISQSDSFIGQVYNAHSSYNGCSRSTFQIPRILQSHYFGNFFCNCTSSVRFKIW